MMSDLMISREAVEDLIMETDPFWGEGMTRAIFEGVKRLPTIDAVPVGAYEQTRWERDMAISQLKEIGKSLCEKMDNVATVVRCKDCKHRPIDTGGHNYGQDLFFPDEDNVCPCQCGDPWYSWMPKDDWFCANGERSEEECEDENWYTELDDPKIAERSEE